jgi:hypothetical protein
MAHLALILRTSVARQINILETGIADKISNPQQLLPTASLFTRTEKKMCMSEIFANKRKGEHTSIDCAKGNTRGEKLTCIKIQTHVFQLFGKIPSFRMSF